MASPATARPRTSARVAAVQALFQAEQSQTSPETVIDEFVRHRLGELPGSGGFEDGRAPDANVPLFARIVRTATQQQDTLDPMLAAALSADWPIERLDPVLRALLRAARGDQRIPRRGARFFHRRRAAHGQRGAGYAGAAAAAGGVCRRDVKEAALF